MMFPQFHSDFIFFTVKQYSLYQDDIVNDNCSICCDNLQHGSCPYVCMLKCNHPFHKKCIDK